MLETKASGLVGKGFATLVYALVLYCGLSAFAGNVSAECQSVTGCTNSTDTSSTDTSSTDTNSTDTNSTDTNSTDTNSTDTNSTSPQIQYSNGTLSLGGFSNATGVAPAPALSFDQYSNSTSVRASRMMSLPEQLPVSDGLDEKNTHQVIPMRMYYRIANSTGASVSSVKGGSNQVQLDGSASLSEDTHTQYLKSLTISAWVKPDYSQGSSVFTVVSDTDAFILAVNNDMPPAKVAVFSIFDGIKWTTVESKSQVPESWTFITAMFDGKAISIYINGSLENYANMTGVPILVDGKLATMTGQNLTTDANVTVGAYYEKDRSQTRNHFSGSISGLNLYDSMLTPSQIDRLFLTTRPSDNMSLPN